MFRPIRVFFKHTLDQVFVQTSARAWKRPERVETLHDFVILRDFLITFTSILYTIKTSMGARKRSDLN